jgi:hypothetical protein
MPNTLGPGEELGNNQTLLPSNRRSELFLQRDGNLYFIKCPSIG